MWEAVCANAAMATPAAAPAPRRDPAPGPVLHRIARDPYRFGLGCADRLDRHGFERELRDGDALPPAMQPPLAGLTGACRG